ncbi:antitoxin [Streptomyces sp. NPDC021093]|uniref:antitoxin n=1 Tax=Streptomyces sp. NPDC021093 TaxID=3365112 RepID=UPI003792DA98
MAKTQLNVRVDAATAEVARARALQRGVSVNRYIEELVTQDAGEVGRTFVDAAADFMRSYASVFAEESAAGRGLRGERDPTRESRREGPGAK